MSIISKFNSPIRKNILANFYGIGIILFQQILLIPFYIFYWGDELYSDWIVLSALSALFSMSDGGLNTVIQNRFVIKYAAKDYEECKTLMCDNILIITIVFIICLGLTTLYFSFFDITTQLNIHVLNKSQSQIIFMALLCNIFFSLYSGIFNPIYRAFHNNAKGVFIDNTAKLISAIIILCCLILRISMVTMSYIMIIPFIFSIFYKWLETSRLFNYSITLKYVDFKLLVEVFLPSISFMSFLGGNFIITQGFTILVNKFFGAETLISFNTTRTMCNFIKTFLNSIQYSVSPEYSIAYGENNTIRMRNLHRKALRTTIVVSLALIFFLLLLGPTIYRIWTGGQIVFSYSIMSSLLLVLFFDVLWNTSAISLTATNNHTKIGLTYLGLSSAILIFAYLLCLLTHNLSLSILSLLIVHGILSIYAIRYSLRLTKDNFISLLFNKTTI